MLGLLRRFVERLADCTCATPFGVTSPDGVACSGLQPACAPDTAPTHRAPCLQILHTVAEASLAVFDQVRHGLNCQPSATFRCGRFTFDEGPFRPVSVGMVGSPILHHLTAVGWSESPLRASAENTGCARTVPPATDCAPASAS